jgi:hypothetical protein
MKAFASLSVCFVAVLLAAAVLAQDKAKKEVTLKGSLLCAKCALGQAAECTTAIQVKEGDKTITYLLDDKGAGEDYHDAICGGGKKEGTVVGTVEERAGSKYIKPSKVTYAK